MNSSIRHNASTIEPTQIFNSAVAASAIGAAWEIGGLDELKQHMSIDIGEFADRHDLHAESVVAIFTALASVSIVSRKGDRVEPGVNFDEVYEAKGLFYWLMQGGSELFPRMGAAARMENRAKPPYTRDSRAISIACRDINRTYFDPTFWQVMRDREFTMAADLGCGSGERIIQMVSARPDARGVGVDIAHGALQVAGEAVEAAGLGPRISLIRDDVLAIEPRPEFESVDLLTSFLMGHDFWPRERCVETLARIRSAFPNARSLLLGDTARTAGVDDTDLPLFTLGFEAAHAVMGVYLPTVEEWRGVFEEAGWRCRAEHPIPTPASTVIFDLERLP